MLEWPESPRGSTETVQKDAPEAMIGVAELAPPALWSTGALVCSLVSCGVVVPPLSPSGLMLGGGLGLPLAPGAGFRGPASFGAPGAGDNVSSFVRLSEMTSEINVGNPLAACIPGVVAPSA